MTAPGATQRRSWAELVADVLESVRFDTELGAAVLDRTAEMIVRTRRFHAPAAEVAEALRQALGSNVTLSGLVDTGHTEAQVRRFLEQLDVRLTELRPWPEWRYVQVDVSAWDSPQVRSAGYLDVSPVRLANQLEIGFTRVTDAGVPLEMAVLRLTGGALVALVREVSAPTSGTVLLVQGDGPGHGALLDLVRQAAAEDAVTWVPDGDRAGNGRTGGAR